jgi:hypothetical protein
MKLFLPQPREIHWLLIVGFCSLGYALYFRYTVIEQSTVGLACQAGLATWLCATRQVVTVLFNYSVFGWLAVAAAVLHLLRPTLLLFAIGIAAAAFGLVLYNGMTASLAASLLVLSLARRAPEPE